MLRLFFVLLLFFGSAMQASAWGGIGHKVVARIAESRLTPEARAEVQKLLASEGDTSLADIALWADAVRLVKIPRQPMHGVLLPLDHSPYDPARECKRNICAIGAIKEMERILADKEKWPVGARMMALKYLVHLVGDIHQPLHAAVKLKRFVTFQGNTVSLHKVWDSGIINTRNMDSTAMASLIEKTITKPVAYADPVAWALEGRDIARDRIIPFVPQNNVLPADYPDRNWDIISERLHEAGWRLADTLNRVLANSNTSNASNTSTP